MLICQYLLIFLLPALSLYCKNRSLKRTNVTKLSHHKQLLALMQRLTEFER